MLVFHETKHKMENVFKFSDADVPPWYMHLVAKSSTMKGLLDRDSSVGRAGDCHMTGPGLKYPLKPGWGLTQPSIPLWVGKISTSKNIGRTALVLALLGM